MWSIFIFIFFILSRIVLFVVLLIVVILIGLKLWLEPVKSVCKCKTKLNGKVALVTGGNSGIGLETAKDLAKRGARVIIASRDAKKAEFAIANITKEIEDVNIEFRYLDLSSFTNIRKFAEDFNRTFDRLDILVNNAGCAGLKKRFTDDKIDLVMQINYLGPFLLTNLLLHKLKSSRPSRIVIVSSYGHKFCQFDPNDLRGLKTEGYWYRYANSKLCNILWMRALATKVPRGITVNALHPGLVKTDICKRMAPLSKNIVLFVTRILFRNAKEGAQTTIHLCVAPELEYSTGLYYSDCRPSSISSLAQNNELAERIWAESIRLTEKCITPT